MASDLPDGKSAESLWDGRCWAVMTFYDSPGVHKRCSVDKLALYVRRCVSCVSRDPIATRPSLTGD